jgi:hypothetical protein
VNLPTQIENVANRFADIGEFAELHGAIWRIARWVAKEGLDGERSRRRVERVYWVLKRHGRYMASTPPHVASWGETSDRSGADYFESRSDAFDERDEDMKTLGVKVVRVSVFRVRRPGAAGGRG